MTSPSRTSRGTFWAGNVLIALYCIRATAAWSLSSHSVGKTSFSSLLFRRELSFVAVSPHHGAHITSLHRGRRSIHQNSLILRAQMDEIPDEDDANLPEQERVRKRDILKRKLGLGGGSDDDRVKLNTDGLFQGMPGIDSIIGSGSPKVIKNPPVKSDKEIKFRKQGEIIEENFLTSEEEEELKNEYEKKKQEAESFVVKKMSEGNFQFSEAGVTEEDGRKIADYIVEVERAKIRKQKNEERKKQTLEQWEKESRQKEDARVEAVIKDGLEYISERDPIAREIMRDWDAEAKENEEQDNRIQEMNEYQEMIEKKKNETAQAKIDSLSTQNVDFDDLFEESLNEIKKGRSEKLGGRDLGFYANTIELEESAAYVRGRKEEKQFQTEVDAEWKNSGEMGEIVPPKDMYEKRKLILISRKIVSARDPSLEATRTETIPQVDYGEEEGDDDDDEVDDGWVALEEKPMTAKETVQAYKELNAWREYRAAEKKNEDFFTRNEERINRTNFNKKSTEEIDAERFPDILRSQLKSDDSIEDASNDVLMKELMQEGVTTERAIRLIDKLLGKRQDKSEDDAIKGFLEYMRETFLAQNETPAEEEVSAKPKSKPIDLSELLRASIFEDEPSASAQKPMSLSADSEPGLGSVGKLEPDRPMPPPSIPYVSPTEQAQQFDQEIPPPPDSPFFRAARASKEPAPPNEDLAADMFRNYVKRKGDDDETRGKQEAAFMDFLKYEEEMKKKLDDMSVDTDITDINEYADDVMSELKPRPGRAKPEDFMSVEDLAKAREELSKSRSMVLDDDEVYEEEDKAKSETEVSYSSKLPEWFVQEKEELGFKIKAEDNGLSDEEIDAMIEERQRLADEYLKEEGRKNPGFDIAEELRSLSDPEDELYDRKDLFYSFDDRKQELLEYTELTVEDVNMAMYWKDDISATGINHHLLERQRPLSEYGAIFRLEGVLVDMTGLQTKAWKKVADEHGFLVDSSELFRLASIHRAAAAVHRVFMWTLDNFEWERIADTHRTALDEVFNAWLESDGNFVSATSDRNTEPTQPSDEDVDALDVIVWEKLADKLGKTRPTEDEVNLVIKSGWVEGVRDVLGWTSDEKEIDGIISDCGEMWDAEHALLIKRYDEEHSVGASDVQLQQGVKEWLATLRDGEIPCAVMSFLDADQLDTILRITGLDDYFPPDKRVSASNTYPTVMDEMLGSALRVERLPNHCVVFDNAPTSANDAHEVQMKSVSFVDHYNKYDLTAADSTFEGLWDLDLMLMRKFFVERTDLELQLDLDTASAMEKKPTLTKTAFKDGP